MGSFNACHGPKGFTHHQKLGYFPIPSCGVFCSNLNQNGECVESLAHNGNENSWSNVTLMLKQNM